MAEPVRVRRGDARAVGEQLARWERAAADLEWDTPWRTLHEPGDGPGRWFAGGTLNATRSCVDRHAAGRPEAVAVLWEGEPGDARRLTYAELAADVDAAAAALVRLGVGPGDRVALHLGWLPELVVALLACARLGAVHTVLPTPLPSEALAERIEGFAPTLLVTQDGAWRHGQILPLKARADEALAAVAGVQHTVVVRRTGLDVAWFTGDLWWHDLLDDGRGLPAPVPVSLPADHPFCAVNLANRRGRAVSVLHGTGNLLASASAVHRYGLTEPGVIWCAAEVSWLGAQAHGILGPLAWGDTAVMFEGTLDVPDRNRTWSIIERYRVQTLLTSPSVVRRLRGWAHDAPPKSAVSSVRRVLTMGEPLEPELRAWLGSVLPEGTTIGDGWGQVELGGVVTVDAAVDPARLPDLLATVVGPDGTPLPDGQMGELVATAPWAGTLLRAEGTGADDVARHWRRPGVYSSGDLVRRIADGRWEFQGRMDEIVSISGQLVSLDEVRAVLLDHPWVTAADVASRADPRLGSSLVAAVVLDPQVADHDTAARELLDTVRETLGGLARPRALVLLDRIGGDLSDGERRQGLVLLAPQPDGDAARVSWSQLVAAVRPA